MSKNSQLGVVIAGVILPVVVYGLLGYTWYIYVFRICGRMLVDYPEHKAQAIAFIIISSLLWLMSIICYSRILFTGPGKPVNARTPLLISESTSNNRLSSTGLPRFYYAPKLFQWEKMTSRRIEGQDNADTIMPVLSSSKQDGQARYCHMCECFKPDRAHHCKECNRCVLKMDHHCPWVSGCVGFENYKFFFLFVFYTGFYGLWIFVSALPTVITAINDMGSPLDPQWIVLIVIAFIFGFTVCGFSGVHASYIFNNETTIEHLADRPNEIRVDFDTSGHNFEIVSVSNYDNLWDVGKINNWKIVMGNSAFTWFLPIKRGLGDGYYYPYNDRIFGEIVKRAQQQHRTMEVPSYGTQSGTFESERVLAVESTVRMF
ncbi:zf-DHHC-domain-containing protein [Backusella circina FSU 941]|nr:zf-DHHC-domain-containing protein [Backusella circina FSU 941]